MTLSPQFRCPRCGVPVGGTGIEGHCARCLAETAFRDLLGEGGVTGGAGQEGKSSAVPGGRMGGYELLGELGRGGMGIVYRARQVGLGREVALKVLAPGPWAGPRERSRFRREAAAIAALRHPNIVTVYEIGEADGHAFLAMELIAGGSLAERTASGPLASNVAAEMVLAVAGAMAAAHAAGVLHRDLKPGNILVGGDGAPRVADFGLARMVGEYGDEPTLSGQVFGSPGYLPPEQADPSRGEVSFAADIYALGALLYHLLTGRAPFTGGTIAAVLGQVLEDPPVPPGRHVSSVSRDLEVICLKCLEKEPVRRYPSAAAVADDLRAFLERRPISARRVGGMERAVLWARRRPALAGWATLLLIVSATGLAAFTWQAAVNRRNLYAADLRLASQALEDGDLGRARELLAFHQPLAGKAGDFAWRLFRNRSAGDPRVVLGEHPWIVNAVAWSPDGRRLASGSVGSGTVEADIRLWDMGGTPPTSRVLARHGAREITWMSDGGSLFAARPDGAVVQLSIPEGRVLREFPGRSLALSGDGHRLLVCEGSPFFWDEEPGAGAVTLHELHPGGRVVSLGSSRLVAIAPAGHLAAVSDLRTSVRLLALPEGRETGRLQLVSPVWGLTFSPDAAWLVATGPGNEVQVWETAEARSETGAGLETGEGRKPRRLSGHLRGTWRSAFSPDGRWLATASSDQSVRLWETGTWQAAGVLHGHGSEVWCVAFRPDGNGLVSGGKDRSVIQWTMPLGRGEEEAVAASYQPIAVGPDGRAVATVASDDSWVTLVHDTRERGGGVRRIADCRPLAFTSDGAELLGVAPGFRWRTIRLAGGVRDQGESDSGRQLEHQADETEPYEWSTGGGTKRLAGLAEGGSVSVWDLGNGQRVARHELPVRRPFFVHLRSDGEWLAVTGGEPGFWAGPVGGGPLRRLTAHRDLGKWAAFSADGRWLATAAVDATVRLWRLPGLSEVAVLRGHPTEVSCVAFSPDGDVLVSSEEGIGLRFWHLPTLREMGVMSLPDAIPGLVFSPDGGSLAVMASHSRVRLLRAPAGL